MVGLLSKLHTSTKMPTHTHVKREKAQLKQDRIDELNRLRNILREKIAEKGIDIEGFFKMFDKNGDGVFHPREFELAFVALDIEVAKADLRRFIHLTDTNNDGRIDFKEFHTVLHAQNEFNQSDIDKAGGDIEADLDASFEAFEK